MMSLLNECTTCVKWREWENVEWEKDGRLRFRSTITFWLIFNEKKMHIIIL